MVDLLAKEVRDVIGKYVKDQFAVWLEALKDPVSIISRYDLLSTESLVASLHFLLFIYLIVFLLRVPPFVIFLKLDVLNPTTFLVLLLLNAASFIIFILAMYLSTKIMLGHGTIMQICIASIYLMAFLPLLQIVNYFSFASPLTRSSMTGEKVTAEPATANIVSAILVLVLVLIFIIFFIVKMVPAIKYINLVGTIRAIAISTMTIVFTFLAWYWSIFPITIEYVRIVR